MHTLWHWITLAQAWLVWAEPDLRVAYAAWRQR